MDHVLQRKKSDPSTCGLGYRVHLCVERAQHRYVYSPRPGELILTALFCAASNVVDTYRAFVLYPAGSLRYYLDLQGVIFNTIGK